ncbi:MAG TPA: glucans biosynthesis glucosyltransferase MdoH [Usitatibacter sp.]
MGLHPAPGLSAASQASVVERYIARLPLSSEERDRVRASAARASNERSALASVHVALARGIPPSGAPAFDSIPARLRLALGEDAAQLTTAVAGHPGYPRLAATPPLNRSSMAPHDWLEPKKEADAKASPRASPAAWARDATSRRFGLTGLVILQSIVATYAMSDILPYKGAQLLEVVVLAVFAVLFAWISAGFWTALAGFVLLMRGHDRFAVTRHPVTPLADSARTAIVMPICNEDVTRVFAGLRSTCESLVRTGESRHFDVFILSDSGDPDARVAEVAAWLELQRAMGKSLRVHYRWRQHHIKRKSGNVADFCRRWGKSYKYMVVLDADSVMTGACLVRLAQLMESDATAGIIQTSPHAFGRQSLFARIQQFATSAYGPLFTAGLHFWQLGEAHYWGHNAILRVEPFMQHCALGRLPGDGVFSGEILSHDFVEAALMRRAGWGVWIAYDLPGSYEEVPPNLIDELARDRRWCLGNLMNLRMLRLEGVHPAHRAVFMIGFMAYMSAPLWFLSLALGTALLAQHVLMVPEYFTQAHQLFPIWPEWHPERALALFGSTAVVLFLPKVLASILIVSRRAGAFGRGLRASASVVIETVFSALFAPIRMIFHTEFVIAGVAGFTIRWKSPPRADSETTWKQAFRRHGAHTILGLLWIALVWWLDERVLPWILPVAGALLVSMPLSVLSSRVRLGLAMRKAGLFVTPEEIHPPEEVRRTLELSRSQAPRPTLLDAVVDPITNALACASATPRGHSLLASRTQRATLVARALVEGLESLDRREQVRLLNDPIALSNLHFDVWSTLQVHPSWFRTRDF